MPNAKTVLKPLSRSQVAIAKATLRHGIPVMEQQLKELDKSRQENVTQEILHMEWKHRRRAMT